ncbi:MAG TPA: putative toxin-antitoxin system toxin component, PIN family [Mycobacteriales bacterium]
MPLASAVIDPNVLLSALIKPASGNPAELVKAIQSGELAAVVSPILLAQLDETLARPKFRRYFTLIDGWTLRGLLEVQGRWHSDPPPGPSLTRDLTDDYLVRLYRASGADWLVSGDKDLLEADAADVAVLSPQQAVAQLTDRRS